ncbi:MAG: hypothetical protein HYV27_06595 [Candidatus Hydrogenedentes bacterium]|nr:hypothetical protein [Candidatus Hydrogenedentota bacterium]
MDILNDSGALLGFFFAAAIPFALLGAGVLGLWFTYSLSSVLDGPGEQRSAQHRRYFFGALILLGFLWIGLISFR